MSRLPPPAPPGGVRRLRRLLCGAGIALALVLTGTACATIPLGGGPASYRDVVKGDPLRKPYVRVVPTPPRPEWGPEEVVTGFLSAMAGVGDDGWSVARMYLVDGAARTWRPQAGVTVYDEGTFGRRPVRSDDATEAAVTLRGTITGAIDTEGRYRAETTPEGRQMDQQFELVKERDGWRITQVPDGLLLTEDDVRRAYRSVKLYYLDRLQRGLVVDQVRIPVDPSSDFAESIVERLLKGPTSGLRDAVGDAVPAGTELLGVSTEDDRVVVDLNEAATNAISTGPRGDSVEAMAAQIGWTLDQLTEHWDIEIRVNGEAYYPEGSPLRAGYDRYGRFDPWLNPDRTAVYFTKDGALHTQNAEGEPEPVPGAAGRPDAGRTGMAVSGTAQTKVAALVRGGRAIEVTHLGQSGQWHEWITGTNLTRPAWDRYDVLWAVDRLGERASRVLRHDGNRLTRVAAPWLEGVGVREMRVARDGVRVAAVVQDEQGVHVRVGTIMTRGEETRMGNPRTLLTAADGENFVGIAWRDATTLLVLANGKAGRSLSAVSVTDGVSESVKGDACMNSITALGDRVLAGADCGAENPPQVISWDPAKQLWPPLLKAPATAPLLPLD